YNHSSILNTWQDPFTGSLIHSVKKSTGATSQKAPTLLAHAEHHFRSLPAGILQLENAGLMMGIDFPSQQDRLGEQKSEDHASNNHDYRLNNSPLVQSACAQESGGLAACHRTTPRIAPPKSQ
ncbi:MAG: hypothetical protein OXI08_05105, partial [Cyanobacteria bacterium MAG IRC4_bin_6]|nr:hypothetical protein [Cyanobacteria bacterium MAG IRC4_bin_6]